MEKKREEALQNFEVATMYDGGVQSQKEHERNMRRHLLFTFLNLLVIAAAIFVIAFVVFKGFLGMKLDDITKKRPRRRPWIIKYYGSI